MNHHLPRNGIYRYSRHPQYLGFILWSYGLLIYDTYVFKPVKGGYFASPSIIWLTVVMIIIAIALYEENHMVKIYGEKYIQYMSRTPFLIPLPKKLENILTYPAKLILKNNRPQKPLEYITVFLTYYITPSLCLKSASIPISIAFSNISLIFILQFFLQ
jgi:hypothetical protein